MAATAGPLPPQPQPSSASSISSSSASSSYPPGRAAAAAAHEHGGGSNSNSNSNSNSAGGPSLPDSPVAHSVRSAASSSAGPPLQPPSAETNPLGAGASRSITTTTNNNNNNNNARSLTSSITSSSAASYDQDEEDEDDDHDGIAPSGHGGHLSADRAGRSGKAKHALFFSTSRTREATSGSGRSTPLGATARADDYYPQRSSFASARRQSIDESQPLRPGSSTASRQLGSAPPFRTESSSSMPRSTVKSLSGGSSSHAGGDDDDRRHDAIDEVELTPALSRSNSATAELQTAFGFGGSAASAGQPYRHLAGRTVQERRRAYWRSAALNLLLIASWYFFSTLISLYNKWMFDKKHYNFAYPLFVTCFHMIVQAVLSGLALCIFERQLVVRRPNGRRERPSFSDWSTKVVPCGVATALDIGLSNLSLKTITLTFYTMCKSSNLAFVLFFAFIFRLEKIRLSLIGIIALITIGVIMMVAAETQFVLVGAVEVLTASAMGGLRWSLAQMLLDGRGRNSGMGMARNPIATIFWLAPVMAVSMAVASMIVEDWRVVLGSRHFRDLGACVRTLGLVTAPGVLAFCMHLSEFALIQRTSVVTLSVAGIFKEVSTIILASTIFGDELTPINVTGLCITILGIALYNWLKYRVNVNSPSAVGGHAGGAGVEDGGSYGGTGSGTRGEYTQIFDREAEDRAGTRGGGGGSGGSARRKNVRDAQEDEEEISPEEAERRRKREEEADMDGWSTAGVVQTGNGWYDDS